MRTYLYEPLPVQRVEQLALTVTLVQALDILPQSPPPCPQVAVPVEVEVNWISLEWCEEILEGGAHGPRLHPFVVVVHGVTRIFLTLAGVRGPVLANIRSLVEHDLRLCPLVIGVEGTPEAGPPSLLLRPFFDFQRIQRLDVVPLVRRRLQTSDTVRAEEER